MHQQRIQNIQNIRCYKKCNENQNAKNLYMKNKITGKQLIVLHFLNIHKSF